jgi:hypothetical protein
VAGAVEHLELVADVAVGIVVHFRTDNGIVEIGDADWRLEFAARDTFKKVDVARAAIENAAELRAVTEGPDNG